VVLWMILHTIWRCITSALGCGSDSITRSTYMSSRRCVSTVSHCLQMRTGEKLGAVSRHEMRPVATDDHHHHHHLFAQYAEMNSKICNVPDRKANNFSSNNCP